LSDVVHENLERRPFLFQLFQKSFGANAVGAAFHDEDFDVGDGGLSQDVAG
jgi:hypothetical protein